MSERNRTMDGFGNVAIPCKQYKVRVKILQILLNQCLSVLYGSFGRECVWFWMYLVTWPSAQRSRTDLLMAYLVSRRGAPVPAICESADLGAAPAPRLRPRSSHLCRQMNVVSGGRDSRRWLVRDPSGQFVILLVGRRIQSLGRNAETPSGSPSIC